MPIVASRRNRRADARARRGKARLSRNAFLMLVTTTLLASVSPRPLYAAGAAAGGVRSQTPPNLTAGEFAAAPFEAGANLESIPAIIANQWTIKRKAPAAALIDESYLRTIDRRQRSLSLKETVYLALQNSPLVAAARMTPLSGIEAAKMAAGAFDPRIVASGGRTNSLIPATTVLDTYNPETRAVALGLSTNQWEWNFAVNKLLASTNGVLSMLLDNTQLNTNNLFNSINPSYTPTLTFSLIQPLLRSFGWRFANINVRLAETASRAAQWDYARQLQDFTQRVANDYWAVVMARAELQVAMATADFYRDVVSQDRYKFRVGTIAKINLIEAQAAFATAQANVATTQAGVTSAVATLRQDVMFSPSGAFIPETIDPIDRPNPSESMTREEELSLETAFRRSPALAALRERLDAARTQVQYMRNQLLPLLIFGSQLSLTSLAGAQQCSPILDSAAAAPNCVLPPSRKPNGATLPFGGGYATALNGLFGAHYYTYAFYLSFELPLDNAYVKAQAAQTRLQYEQLRRQYETAVSQTVVDVRTALANLAASQSAVTATRAALEYARNALDDEWTRYKVGAATTHDLIQYQSQVATAEGNEIQSEIGLEDAKIALRRADGALLENFQIHFQPSSMPARPWYDRF